ncbi:putative uncharacterized protein C19orf81 homolog [Ptychodera flava]|uniref:putative uncharacterized protein C19orf81 homolog n=1 Tax=Ptychodera flava TaxID=63121 RepID=UPI003969FD96
MSNNLRRKKLLHETQLSNSAVESDKKRGKEDSKHGLKTEDRVKDPANTNKPPDSSSSEDDVDLVQYVRRKARERRRREKAKKKGYDIAFRNIRKFRGSPEPYPFTLCFSYPGVDLTHSDVIDALRNDVRQIDMEHIEKVEFIEMNVMIGTAGLENRWLITVNDPDTRIGLHGTCLFVGGKYVYLRYYDDVLNEDYREYQRRCTVLESEEQKAANRVLGHLPSNV